MEEVGLSISIVPFIASFNKIFGACFVWYRRTLSNIHMVLHCYNDVACPSLPHKTCAGNVVKVSDGRYNWDRQSNLFHFRIIADIIIMVHSSVQSIRTKLYIELASDVLIEFCRRTAKQFHGIASLITGFPADHRRARTGSINFWRISYMNQLWTNFLNWSKSSQLGIIQSRPG